MRRNAGPLERHSWEKREKLFSTKDLKRFKTPLNKASLGERLMQDGNIISHAPLCQQLLSGFSISLKSSNQGPTMSSPIHILRGVQQGSVLSPIFFLVIMDDLLHQLSQSSCGASICRLYLGGADHADDVRAIASSTSSAEAQGAIISDF